MMNLGYLIGSILKKELQMFDWLWAIIIGGVAGWVADLVVPGVKVRILGAIIAGVLGGVLGKWLFGFLKLPLDGALWPFIASVVGAIILLLVYRAIAKK